MNISCKFLADTIISCKSLADQIKSCKMLEGFLKEMKGFSKKLARKKFPCKNLARNMLAPKFQFIGLRVKLVYPYGDVCFSSQILRHLLIDCPNIQDYWTYPNSSCTKSTAIKGASFLPKKLHFYFSFRQKHFENQAIDFASNLIGKSLTCCISAGRWLRPVFLQTQCTTWEVVPMDFHKRVFGRKFIVCSKTEFFHFMFFADLLTFRVLLEAPKSQCPWYLT